ncbi:hypothetical protein DFH29DRAFT_814040, partial [Suillus ampliporus]
FCTNSASCERLFSLFGMILTNLRSRLRLAKMLDLAELSLHLRDEYTRRGSMKDCLHHPRHIIPDPLPHQNQDISTSPTDEIVSEIMPDTSEFDSIVDENSLNFIAKALSHQSALDNIEDPTDIFTSQFEQIMLQLFNFLDDTWTKLTERIGMRSLDDELEFYELVEHYRQGVLLPRETRPFDEWVTVGTVASSGN